MTAQGCLIVDEPGLLTTVQDEGRWGWQHLGVPVGGPMDAASFRRANRLVGNVPGAATLEITLVGPTLEIVGPVTLALAGAPFDARLDGHALAPEAPVHVERRAWLAIGARRRGARAYLAVRADSIRRSFSAAARPRAACRARVPCNGAMCCRWRRRRRHWTWVLGMRVPGSGPGQGGGTGAPAASTETVDAPPLRVLACDLDDDGAALATLCGGTTDRRTIQPHGISPGRAACAGDRGRPLLGGHGRWACCRCPRTASPFCSWPTARRPGAIRWSAW